ncbi:Uroporphyrinogen decarboxylase in heme biosynthesis [Entomophthora muscae]|uniref:Uroporphyrinogen decarboxylase in heme biosynthesis n=1 Tax=Entomophthora muscae TaxID=34485 RepID=A0ACC2S0J0_9FUNG|nr:Uroporphyrinogen decarboxylase in heme biosynthesis [Entomophthora muscae]
MLRDSDFPALKNDLILRTARGEITERVPVWIIVKQDVISQVIGHISLWVF